MKNVFKVLRVPFLVIVYLYAIGNSSLYSTSIFTNKSNIENDITTISANLISFSSQAEGSVDISYPPFPNFKKSYNKFIAIIQTTEHIIANEFNQYRFSSRNFLIRFQKVDLIFPFHYFW